jgi:uncharacterized sodium:solute symporter family permease YidK
MPCALAMDIDCTFIAHYFPELADIQKAFPNLPADKLGHDVAYPAMLTLLPSGLLGLVAASLIAAFMSTYVHPVESWC